ncbi:hypothetical protein ACHAWO_011076, partial [Cyclotella atomus]
RVGTFLFLKFEEVFSHHLHLHQPTTSNLLHPKEWPPCPPCLSFRLRLLLLKGLIGPYQSLDPNGRQSANLLLLPLPSIKSLIRL